MTPIDKMIELLKSEQKAAIKSIANLGIFDSKCCYLQILDTANSLLDMAESFKKEEEREIVKND